MYLRLYLCIPGQYLIKFDFLQTSPRFYFNDLRKMMSAWSKPTTPSAFLYHLLRLYSSILHSRKIKVVLYVADLNVLSKAPDFFFILPKVNLLLIASIFQTDQMKIPLTPKIMRTHYIYLFFG